MNPGVAALTHSLSKYQKEKGFKVLYARKYKYQKAQGGVLGLFVPMLCGLQFLYLFLSPLTSLLLIYLYFKYKAVGGSLNSKCGT